MKVKKPHEQIMIVKKRFGYFPQTFLWHGKTYEVIATEKCQTEVKRGPLNRVERHCFRVNCVEGTFELFQDILSNTWHVKQFRACKTRPRAA